VLIADDDAPVRRYVRDVLGDTYRVLEAPDGEAAWMLAREHRPALVISDVMMPTLDGFALCHRIRNSGELATTPVVFLTARAEEEARVEGWKTGADAYLTKPFSGKELSAVAENLIEVRQLLRTRVKVPDWMATNAPDVPSPDAEFLDRVQRAVGEHIDNTNFGVEWLADEVGLSARQLQRRLKKLTRLTAASFIKTMRLEHAAQLLAESNLQVQEVAHAVGYEDANYFSRLFRQAYGVPPSEYVKEAT
jgi:DNA-binding response OmpR family regulator